MDFFNLLSFHTHMGLNKVKTSYISKLIFTHFKNR